MKKITSLFFSIIFLGLICQLTVKGQENHNRFCGMSAALPSSKDAAIQEKKKNWKEIIEKRSVYSSEWKSDQGNIISEFSEIPVNYYHNGSLIPVITEPNLNNNRLEAHQQPIPVSIDNNGSVYINSGNSNQFTVSKNARINGKPIISSTFQLNGENAELTNILPGVNKTFHFSYAGVKYNYEITNPLTTQHGDLIIEEEILLPVGATIVRDELHGETSSSGWKGALRFLDKSGNEIGKIRAAVCFDQQKNFVVGTYNYSNKNGKTILSISVPSSWMNDPSRSYPVIIDPLVTGPTTTYTGPDIPSCLAPANNSDSILVTIPAQVTVTDLFVSGSYYADPFTTCIMSDGRMWFSTNCDSSQVFTITGTTGSSPGTAYLTNYDLRYPLLCCYPQSCNAQTFYLSMHLQRIQPGTGCNAIYLYHDPLGGYPFKAYIEGHTVEYTGVAWSINPNSLCSNVCNFNGTVSIKYGVPPYTVTHPWMNGSLTWQTPAGCSYGTSSKVLNLTLPNCPWYCDTITQVAVPSPTVTDACGNTVTVFPAKTLAIKKAPEANGTPSTQSICSGDTFNIALSSCVSGSNLSWSGNGQNGNGASIVQSIVNTGSTPIQTNYIISATANGCNGLNDTVSVITFPYPDANYSYSPQIVIVNEPVIFSDNTTAFGDSISNWYWSFGDNTFSGSANPSHTYSTPGTYTVCLLAASSLGCPDTICKVIDVIPAEIIPPNIITPNNDSLNDVLEFNYLEFFPNNNLKIFNRWGNLVYEKNGYQNDWNGSGQNDGTYYYVLTINDDKRFSSTLQLIRGK
jgi:gliding motility-associated-like protein